MNTWQTNNEAAALYYDWFITTAPERIAILTKTAHISPSCRSALEELSKPEFEVWFLSKVGRRLRSTQEIDLIKQQLPVHIEGPNWDISDATKTLCEDAGVFFGQGLISAFPELEWRFFQGKQNDINHNQPIIAGFKNVVLNPVSVFAARSYAHLSGAEIQRPLGKTISYWVTLAQKN